VSQIHEATNTNVEHPQRDLDRALEVRCQPTANDSLSLPDPREVHPDHPIEPRVPEISHLSRLGTMGVPLLVCTTRRDRIRRSTRRLRTSSTSRRCRPNGRMRVNTSCPPRRSCVDDARPPWTTLHRCQIRRAPIGASVFRQPSHLFGAFRGGARVHCEPDSVRTALGPGARGSIVLLEFEARPRSQASSSNRPGR
jgi:hypothetical protein